MKKKFEFNFENKTVIITGGSSPIGRELVDSFLDLKANVIVIDKISKDNKNFINKYSKKVKLFNIDLSIKKNVVNLITKLKKIKRLDCLINNAAFVKKKNYKSYTGSVKEQSIDVFKNSLDVNLVAPFHLIKELSPLMKNSPNPSIINISSIYSFVGPDFELYKNTNMGNSAGYSSSKAALNQLTVWFASALSPKIRVNSISPGGVYRNQPATFVKKYISKCLLGKMASEENIVGPVIFLASDLSSYITGQNLVIDGGYSKV